MKKVKVAKNKNVKIKKDGKQIYAFKASRKMIIETPDDITVE